MEYEHPLYTPASVAAQRRLPELVTDRVAFAGAYHGWGFHEDGARSGLPRPSGWGSSGWSRWLRCEERQRRASTPPPWGIYAPPITTSGASRSAARSPTTRTPGSSTSTTCPTTGCCPGAGRFEGRDHLGDPDRSIKDNLAAFLAGTVSSRCRRVLMAAHPRAFGHSFQPDQRVLGDPGARRPCTVVEVHNTYGDRHAYLVRPDERGRATTPKQMYVSPFHGTDAATTWLVPVPGERLTVSVTLTTDEGARFSASLTGTRSTHGLAGPRRR